MASMTFRQLVRSLMREEQETRNVKPSADMLDRVYINNQTGETVICRAVLDDIVIIEKSICGVMQRIPVQYFDILYTEVEGGRANG